ncbi:hypothetical protein QOT17_016826 [Balamuthia mandrillaris]
MECQRRQQFMEELRQMDELYAEVNAEERFLLQSTVTHCHSWILTCTDLHEQVWEKEFFYEDVRKQKRAGSIENENWRHYFSRLRTALQADNVFLALKDDDTMEVSVWYFHEGAQVSTSFLLAPIRRAEARSKICDIVFELMSVARKAKQMQQATQELQESLERQKEELSQSMKENKPSQDMNSFSTDPSTQASLSASQSCPQTNILKRTTSSASFGAGEVVSTSVKTNMGKAKKRRVGYSIVNPRLKRFQGGKGAKIVPKGARIEGISGELEQP